MQVKRETAPMENGIYQDENGDIVEIRFGNYTWHIANFNFINIKTQEMCTFDEEFMEEDNAVKNLIKVGD